MILRRCRLARALLLKKLSCIRDRPAPSESQDIVMVPGEGEMTGIPTIFCVQCKALREVNDWRERGDDLLIELGPCQHRAVRTARLEWLVGRQPSQSTRPRRHGARVA